MEMYLRHKCSATNDICLHLHNLFGNSLSNQILCVVNQCEDDSNFNISSDYDRCRNGSGMARTLVSKWHFMYVCMCMISWAMTLNDSHDCSLCIWRMTYIWVIILHLHCSQHIVETLSSTLLTVKPYSQLLWNNKLKARKWTSTGSIWLPWTMFILRFHRRHHRKLRLLD